jgi:enediyne biosynthesis protein E4
LARWRPAVGAGLAVVVVVALALAVLEGPHLVARESSEVPHFVEQAESAGVSHSYQGDFDYFVGGGVAAFDCNGDGRPELFLAGGTAPAQLFVNDSTPGGRLTFSPLPDPATDLTGVTGAYPIDIDGDGVIDLAVLRHGENVLLRGLGGCRFERANEPWGFAGGDEWSTAFSAKWGPGATWPTVAVGNYLGPADANGVQPCLDDQVYRPGSAGTAFGPPIPLTPSWCTLSLLFTDWDRSGRSDLRVSNDRHYYGELSAGEEQLWSIPASGQVSQYTAADGWQPVRVWGMGIADYDVNGDGYPDYYLTSQGDNKLQLLASGPSNPQYADKALAMGVTATRPYVGDTTLPSTAWHSEFQDVNNDGRMDLFVSKGNIDADPAFARQDPSDLFLGQADDSFSEAGQEAGIVDYGSARGAAIVDLNGDGMLDLVVVERLENVRVYRNVGSGTAEAPEPIGNWLALSLQQPGANRDAIGSWVEVKAGDLEEQRELTIGGGHASGDLVPLHFGLGTMGQAQVRVTWPDGSVGEWQTVSANATYLIQPGSAPQVIEW